MHLINNFHLVPIIRYKLVILCVVAYFFFVFVFIFHFFLLNGTKQWYSIENEWKNDYYFFFWFWFRFSIKLYTFMDYVYGEKHELLNKYIIYISLEYVYRDWCGLVALADGVIVVSWLVGCRNTYVRVCVCLCAMCVRERWFAFFVV